MRIAYFDCFAGISGEMMLGAPQRWLSRRPPRAMLSNLHAGDYSLEIEAVARRPRRDPLPGAPRAIAGGRTGHTPGANGNGNSSKTNGHGGANSQMAMPMATPTPVPDLEHIVTGSALPGVIKGATLTVLRKLSDAEAAVYHGHAPYPTHASSREALVTIVAVTAGLLLLNMTVRARPCR